MPTDDSRDPLADFVSRGQAAQKAVDEELAKAQVLDTSNRYMVGVRGDNLVIMRGPMHSISPLDALNLAAYLVALAEPHVPEGTFDRLLEAVKNT